ncbi:MAG: ABC transporter permease subunit [Chloroflexi bacterium]|nr:ABC transporter permease subunit [Chloroflexota bacterium]
MKRIRTIIDKEWAEVFKNRMVIMVMLVLPLIFTVMPLIMLKLTASTGMEGVDPASAGVPAKFLVSCSGMNAGECMQIYIVNQFLLMFMLMPLMIPVTIAAYSIVGEKTTRSLEPLLATPITTKELLTGKALAAVIPAALISIGAFALFALGLFVLGIAPMVRAYILSPTWLLAILALGPILSVISVMVAIFISSRVNDPRAAEQISGVLVGPMMIVLVLQLAGLVVIDVRFMLAAIVGCLLLAVGMVYAGAKLFQRETILTRWK